MDATKAKDFVVSAFSSASMRTTKYDSYLTAYSELLAEYIDLAIRGNPVRLLEIGVLDGGSLQAWKSLFGPMSTIVGLDINPECRRLECESFEIRTGDQGDPATWQALQSEYGNFDIVIDDGSHIGFSQIQTVECSIKTVLSAGGLLVIEDTHTAFMPEFPGATVGRNFIDFLVEVVGCIHSRSCRLSSSTSSLVSHIGEANIYKRKISNLSIYESIIAFHVASYLPDSVHYSNRDRDERGMQDLRHMSKLIS
jgi:hypothetical protein